MCLITGFINFENSTEKTLQVMICLEYRGVDGNGIYTNNKTYTAKNIKELSILTSKHQPESESPTLVLGHNLHSTTSHTPQPISQQGTLIANCEIYNWETLAKRHNITAKNDAELLLKLLEKNKLKNIKLC